MHHKTWILRIDDLEKVAGCGVLWERLLSNRGLLEVDDDESEVCAATFNKYFPK